jgi:hypothetical protein
MGLVYLPLCYQSTANWEARQGDERHTPQGANCRSVWLAAPVDGSCRRLGGLGYGTAAVLGRLRLGEGYPQEKDWNGRQTDDAVGDAAEHQFAYGPSSVGGHGDHVGREVSDQLQEELGGVTLAEEGLGGESLPAQALGDALDVGLRLSQRSGQDDCTSCATWRRAREASRGRASPVT